MNRQIRLCSTTEGVRIAYAASGQGPALVKTANWFTHLDLESSNPACRHWVEAHSRRHRLIRYDPRGSGLSDRNVDDFTLEAWIRDLEAVVDAAGLGRFALIGGCQGSAVAIAYAARHPDRVSRLVLYGGYLRGAYAGGEDPRAIDAARSLQHVIATGWGHPTRAFCRLFSNLLMPDGLPGEIAALTDLARRSTSAANAERFWETFHSIDATELAPRVQAPTLVLHARGDALVPFEEGRTLAYAIPGARFVPLDGVNHLLLERDPAWRQYVDAVETFLAEDELRAMREDHAFPDAGLTRRELEVLDNLARGLSNDEIATVLSISPRTVRNHLTKVFGKLAVARRSQAIVCAREAGLGRRVRATH